MSDDSLSRHPRAADPAPTTRALVRSGIPENLTSLSSAEIDELPFGYVALRPDGTVLRYNQYESELARKSKALVLGRNFFTEVAPCTQVQDFEGRFRDFVADRDGPSTMTFDFVFAFRHGQQNVRIGFVRSPANNEIIMTVNRQQSDRLTLQAGTRSDLETGALRDLAGNRVVATHDDLWRALDSVLAQTFAQTGTDASLRVGLQWGMQQTFRVDRHLQRERGTTIREVSLGEACQILSMAVATLGLGQFEMDPSLYANGILVVTHTMSPFVEFFSSRERGSCSMLAGFHAGQFSYLSGRRLTGREVTCSQDRGMPCRFVVGTEERIETLVSADPDSPDGRLLGTLRPDHRGGARWR